MRTFFSKSFLAGLIGGICAYLLFSFLDLSPYGLSARYFDTLIDSNVSAVVTPTLTPSPADGIWEKIAEKTALNLVGIQVFQDNRLVRQGSGIVVSSDGLIATVSDLAVANAVYQIFYEGQILKATIVASDFKLNLILLKSLTSYAGVADFAAGNSLKNSQDVLLAGKVIHLSKPVLATQKGLISYITDKTVVVDAVVHNYLPGFSVVNSSGKMIGICYLRNGQINLVRSEDLQTFIGKYLNKK